MQELIGQQLGQYHIEAKIGEGGMAAVFKAFQPSLDRHVAIKVLPPVFAASDPDFVKRFQIEARTIARLHHPHILPIHDFGHDQDYSYIVMRYVEGGQTLHTMMRQRLALEQVVEMIGQLAAALDYAHKRAVVHRDVKPGNVLLDNGWPLLADFGLARISHESAARLTESGIAVGTPAYMSPEQGYGRQVDHRTDIYALGVILYEMLTGTIPHRADSPMGIIVKRSIEPPTSPRMLDAAIPESVAQVTLRALATEPAQRYDSALDFAAALKQAVADRTYREPLFESTVFSLNAPATQPDDKPQEVTRPGQAEQSSAAGPAASLPGRLIAAGVRFKALWLIGGGIIALGAVVWGSGLALSLASALPPTRAAGTAAAAAETPATPTAPPTSTAIPPPAPTATLTPAAPAVLLTDTPLPPSPTPVVLVITATPAASPTATLTPAPVAPPPTPTVTLTPTPDLPGGAFALLKPVDLDQPSYGPTDFEWEWTSPVPPGFGFEVRVWREGEPPAGAHDAVLDNLQHQVQPIAPNRYRLNINIHQAAGVQGRSGEYLWTVALVRVSPDYADTGQQAEPARLRFEAPGAGGGGKDGGSGTTIR